MLLMVSGGMGCGKSAYAENLAVSLGREAIKLACPAWSSPRAAGKVEELPQEAELPYSPHGFAWTVVTADLELAEHLNRINRNSNPFRAESRVVLLDSLSGWLRLLVDAVRTQYRPEQGDTAGSGLVALQLQAQQSCRQVLGALLGFQGTLVIVTEEGFAGLSSDPWERLYISLLSTANRQLSEVSHSMYRVSFGLAERIKGERVKRRRSE